MEINGKLKNLKKRIGREDFLKNRGLGNEIPFYIFDYNPKDELSVRDFVENDLVKAYDGSKNVKLCVIDIFQIMLERLEKEQLFSGDKRLEERKGTEFLYKSFGMSVNLDVMSEEIKIKSKDYNVICIIGAGKIFPMIKAHDLMENLQEIFDFKKVVLFLPGKYDKESIILLDTFRDLYYRAMRLSGEY